MERVLFHTKDTLNLVRDEYNKKNTFAFSDILRNRIFTHSHFTLLYALTRYLKALITVETGTGAGLTSTYILQAIADEGKGNHYSIDLPRHLYEYSDKTIDNLYWVPENKHSGWMIPNDIRKRFTQLLGNSKDFLPPLLEEVGEIDLFFHDSEHTYDMMTWEFEQAWPYLRKGGFLVSHDIDWNEAFHDFSIKVDCEAYPMSGWGFMKKLA